MAPSGGFNAGTLFNNTAVYGKGPQAEIRLSTIAADGSRVTAFGFGVSDPSLNPYPEQVKAVAVDATHVYTAGFDSSLGNDTQWRIEKRFNINGNLDLGFGGGTGFVQSNRNPEPERINAMAIDDAYIYAAGYNHFASGDEQWRVEKRNIIDGSLETFQFGPGGSVESNPKAGPGGPEQITAIAVDATHIYAAGYDNALANDEQWRIEKYDILSGIPDASFDGDGIVVSNPSVNPGAEKITAIAVDATHVYAAGFDNVPGNSQWRVEKRDISTGLLDTTFNGSGIVVSNPGNGPDEINTIAIDDTYIYVAGFDNDPGANGERWRLEKRRKDTGALDTSFNTPNGYIVKDSPTNSGPEKIMSIAVDKDYIFMAGYTDQLSSHPVWGVECRYIDTGFLVTQFNVDGDAAGIPGGRGPAKINTVALSDRYLYVAGFDNNTAGINERWRVEKRKAREYVTGPGTYESEVIDLGGIVNNFNNIAWFPPNYPDPSATLTMDVRAGPDAVDCPGACTGWIGWVTNVPNGSSAGTFSGNRYIQYRATLGTGNINVSPALSQFTLGFSNYSPGAGLESSVFDTGNSNNFLKTISWSENLNGQDVRLQVATSGNGSNWTYCGLDAASCSSTTWLDWAASVNNSYTQNTGDLLHLKLSDADDDRYFKYKVWLSGDGTNSPSADDISIIYDTAYLAVTSPNGPAQTAGTAFNIDLTVRDSNGTVYNGHDHAVTFKLVASSAQLDMPGCASSFTANGNTEYSGGGSYASGIITITGITLCKATTTPFTISAFETSGGALSSNLNLPISTVNVASPLEIAFSTQPSATGIVGEDLNPPPVVRVQDQYGNVDTSAADQVTLSAYKDVACTDTGVSGSLSVTTNPVTASSGAAVFSGVSYDRLETIHLKASSPGFTSICSSAVLFEDSGYVVQVDAVYDLTNNAVDVITSFLRQGSVITGGTITLVDMDIQDGSGVSVSGGLTGPDVTNVEDTVNRVFHTTWDPAGGLVAGTLYTIISQVNYDGTVYQSAPKIMKIDELGNIKFGLDALDTTLTGVQTTVGGIDASADNAGAAVASLDTKISAHAASQAAYRAQTAALLSSLSTKIGSILEDTSSAIPGAIQATIATELAKGDLTEIVTTQAEVKTGGTVPFRYRTAKGLSPTVTVFDPKDAEKVSGAAMQEVGGTGIYVYKITFQTGWGLGNFMVRVDEPNKQATDHVILKVIEDKESAVAAVSAGSAVTIDTLYSRMNKIDSNMTILSTGMNAVKTNTEGVSTDISDLLKTVEKGGEGSAVGAEDAAKFQKYINSVSSVIGSSESTTDYETIIGKLNGLQTTLGSMGMDAAAAQDFNTSAKEKAERVKRFVALIATEIQDGGKVEDAEGKAAILEDYLTDLKATVEGIPKAITTEGITQSVESTLNELNGMTTDKDGLRGITSLVQGDLSEGAINIQKAEDLTPDDMSRMRNDVSSLKSLMFEIRGLLDGEVNQPVVHGWLEGE
jgi:hypothetical protein